jgi:hypothetical protein
MLSFNTNVHFGSMGVWGVPDPINIKDAANKRYVDTKVRNADLAEEALSELARNMCGAYCRVTIWTNSSTSTVITPELRIPVIGYGTIAGVTCEAFVYQEYQTQQFGTDLASVAIPTLAVPLGVPTGLLPPDVGVPGPGFTKWTSTAFSCTNIVPGNYLTVLFACKATYNGVTRTFVLGQNRYIIPGVGVTIDNIL